MASHQPNGVPPDDERGAPVSAAVAFRTAHGGTARAVELLFTNRFKDAELYLRETVTDDPARASLLYGTRMRSRHLAPFEKVRRRSLCFNTFFKINLRLSYYPAYCSFIQGMSSFVENILDDALARVWEADAAGAKEKSLSGKVVQADAHLLGSMVRLIVILCLLSVVIFN